MAKKRKTCFEIQDEEHVDRIIEYSQACIVVVGGRKIPTKELGQMRLKEFLMICRTNHIDVTVGLIGTQTSQEL